MHAISALSPWLGYFIYRDFPMPIPRTKLEGAAIQVVGISFLPLSIRERYVMYSCKFNNDTAHLCKPIHL